MYPKKGTIENGSDADITMVDLKKEMRVRSELFGGFSDYTVYEGWTLTGWPVKTILRGEIVAEDLQVVGKAGFGKLIKRPVTAFN
jgi:dihydropyrimidinase